ncbi:hypothetical protein [Cellulomonas sp. S1-8]|uniref:hypothetical protein n=1 Tax=Cellulomonas sp. S1-8 TaxID=2904790 RepID=UPI002242E65A|nr:hypothetical protein [Cellulomonas sp. S1-8]UZN02751.1 hypothetical protein OKX07_17095 [Cellulomonas sp. S1-8]
MADRIDPTRAGYAFANRFVNVLVTLPNGTPLRTAGLCGGMAYSMLDHARAGRDVPSWPAGLFAPGRVPPDGHLVADHLRSRQLDSFRSLSALRFVGWSVLPDADLGPVAGVRTRTRRELPGILRALTRGRPVVLGMVVARNPVRSGDNHQVVATGFTRDTATGDVVLALLDPNTPGREVTLVETADGWRASNGRLWRGFFHHAYAPRTPPPLPSASRRPTARVRAGTPLALVHVATGRLLVVGDGEPALHATGATTWVPTSGDDPGLLGEGARVRLVATDARRGGRDTLALVDGTPTLAVTPGGAATDTWRVVVDGGGPWRQGSRVRLVHDATGALLRGGTAHPTTTFSPDPSTWWTIASI